MTPRLLLAFSFTLLTADAALAGPPVCDPADPRLCAAPLLKGDPAPYSGQLLTTELAIQLGQKADTCDTRLKLEVAFATKLAAVDLGLERSLHRNDLDASSDREAVLLRELTAAQDTPFWREPVFLVPVSTLGGAALMVLAVWAAGQLR